MNKRILFVDDEANVLRGIQRNLRSMNKEWEIEFCTSGIDALEALSRAHFDVVITDMRMPGMDGAQLLEQVKNRFPRTVRIVLSGQSDRESILRSVGPTHQYLSKPCDIVELKHKLTRAFALRDLLENPGLKEIVCRLEVVPSLPKLYIAVTEALRSPESTIASIGALIENDIGMSAKVLQLTNSAFFGLPQEISSASHAVSLMGIDNIRALVLSVHVFSQFESNSCAHLTTLWEHSFATAGMARAICQAQDSPRALTDTAFTAGLLHDIGRLVLASVCTEEYDKVLLNAAKHNRSAWMAEEEAFGCTHAAVGAYLLGLWGLPDSIVEPVAWHHDPACGAPKEFCPLIAVHVSDYYDHQLHSYDSSQERPVLNKEWMEQIGLSHRLEPWWKICQELALQDKKYA